MFKFQQDDNAKSSSQDVDQDINRGLALLVLITASIVGTSWLFSLPVYFDVKIAAQILPVLFSLSLLLSVTKLQHKLFNKIMPVFAYLFVFCSWSYVIFLNTHPNPVEIESSAINGALGAQYLGASYSIYLLGLCFLIFWLGRYFKYGLYLSLISIVSLEAILILFTDADMLYLLALVLLFVSSAVFSAVSLSGIKTEVIDTGLLAYNEAINETIEDDRTDDYFLPSELKERELKPELDINTLPLNETSITHDWELILRELHGELKNTTDVDLLFKSMLIFLQGAMEFDAAAVGMLQDKSIRKIASLGDDEYLHAKALNWTNLRVKEIFSLREPKLSTQTHLSADAEGVTDPIHRLDVPVISNNKVLGLVTLFRDEIVFDVHDVKLAASIVFHSMIALRQARLQDEINRLSNATVETKLTLYSREQFVTKVKPVFEKLSRPRECSLFIIELDNLDSVIDTQGRDAGALLFKTASKTIMSNLSERDVFGRYGHEGFIILLDETDLMHAKEIAEKIRVKISELKITYQDNVLNTTVSIGLTIVSDPDESLPSLMRKADMGLFVAKENGYNTIKVSL